MDRRVGKSLVGLRLRLRLVLGIEIFDRALAQERPRQDHHADKAGRPVAGALREDRVGPALVPGAARAIARRLAVRIDPDAAFDPAAQAGALVAMQIGAAAGRKRDAVAAQQQLSAGERSAVAASLRRETPALPSGASASSNRQQVTPTPPGEQLRTRSRSVAPLFKAELAFVGDSFIRLA